MNRFVPIVIGLAIAVAGPVSARSIYRYVAPPSQNLEIVAGTINSDGTVKRGAGFTSRLVTEGKYEIRFTNGYFNSGCAAMVVEGRREEVAPFVSRVTQQNCGPIFHVTLWAPMGRVNNDFQFIVVAEQ